MKIQNSILLLFFLSCCFIVSCAFDPPDEELKTLGGNYYSSFDSHSVNDGIKITYSQDKKYFKVVASNCTNIYRDSNVIVFSKNLYVGDKTNYEYFLIDKTSTGDLKKISKLIFEDRIIKLEKIVLENNR